MGRSLPAFLQNHLPDRPDRNQGAITLANQSMGSLDQSGSQDQQCGIKIQHWQLADPVPQQFLMDF
ncbi:MAG: hypothetical protein BJG00_015665 [Limnothrix sp. CACIAM 69d]|nr:MAG: hypothetical protein BJG00_015665 [Limnothrix sp. CACIAM 69d]